jgi:hypothetical protein
MAAPPPTGCFKCGRPGHWSRDCPSSASTNPPAAADAPTNPSHLSGAASRFNAKPRPPAAAVDGEDGKGKKKKERATRPKLTPDLLLSDGGIGFVLRYFPKAFKPRARPGHEVDDLANLIKLYADWHSRLIPYYSFEQFVRKLEKLGAGNRVRVSCLYQELKFFLSRQLDGHCRDMCAFLFVRDVFPNSGIGSPEAVILRFCTNRQSTKTCHCQAEVNMVLKTQFSAPMLRCRTTMALAPWCRKTQIHRWRATTWWIPWKRICLTKSTKTQLM